MPQQFQPRTIGMKSRQIVNKNIKSPPVKNCYFLILDAQKRQSCQSFFMGANVLSQSCHWLQISRCSRSSNNSKLLWLCIAGNITWQLVKCAFPCSYTKLRKRQRSLELKPFVQAICHCFCVLTESTTPSHSTGLIFAVRQLNYYAELTYFHVVCVGLYTLMQHFPTLHIHQENTLNMMMMCADCILPLQYRSNHILFMCFQMKTFSKRVEQCSRSISSKPSSSQHLHCHCLVAAEC